MQSERNTWAKTNVSQQLWKHSRWGTQGHMRHVPHTEGVLTVVFIDNSLLEYKSGRLRLLTNFMDVYVRTCARESVSYVEQASQTLHSVAKMYTPELVRTVFGPWHCHWCIASTQLRATEYNVHEVFMNSKISMFMKYSPFWDVESNFTSV